MDLNRVDLNLLVAFDAVMSEGSVTRAAQRLYIGQSAMSSTLARLRTLLDDPALIREGRQMVPTPLALSLITPVREVLDRVETILSVGVEFDAAQVQPGRSRHHAPRGLYGASSFPERPNVQLFQD